MSELAQAIELVEHTVDRSSAEAAPVGQPGARHRSGPTPPGALPASAAGSGSPIRAHPTTLSSASGAMPSRRFAGPGRRRWIAGLVVGAVAVGGAAALVAGRGGSQGSPAAAPARATPGSSTTEMHVPAPVHHASPSTMPPPADAVDSTETVATAAADAGIADAPAIVKAIDATGSSAHRPRTGGTSTRPPTTGGDNGSSSGSATRPDLDDRGD
jgi:hypothetical protein